MAAGRIFIVVEWRTLGGRVGCCCGRSDIPIELLSSSSTEEEEPGAEEDSGSGDTDDDKDTDDGARIVEECAAASTASRSVVEASRGVLDDLGDGVDDAVGVRGDDFRGEGCRDGRHGLTARVGGRDGDGRGGVRGDGTRDGGQGDG